jgi:DNA-directed RNA polymerase subunit F
MGNNLQKQQKYWETYNTALEAVLQKGVSKEIASQLTDGSAESLAALQSLAQATPEEVQKINEEFAKVEASKDTLAGTIADMETSFTEGMAALKEELENTVKELDKGSEAAQAAADTMAAYVAALGEAEGDSTAQATAIADAVNAALSTIADVDVDITYHYKTEGSPPSEAGGTEGHDAIGTDNAMAGIHLVGEEGPELVMMHGGEKVLTAHETVNALSGSGSDGGKSVQVTFSPVYNVNGGNAADIRAVLEQQSENLYDQVRNIMEDVFTDRRRTAYA